MLGFEANSEFDGSDLCCSASPHAHAAAAAGRTREPCLNSKRCAIGSNFAEHTTPRCCERGWPLAREGSFRDPLHDHAHIIPRPGGRRDCNQSSRAACTVLNSAARRALYLHGCPSWRTALSAWNFPVSRGATIGSLSFDHNHRQWSPLHLTLTLPPSVRPNEGMEASTARAGRRQVVETFTSAAGRIGPSILPDGPMGRGLSRSAVEVAHSAYTTARAGGRFNQSLTKHCETGYVC